MLLPRLIPAACLLASISCSSAPKTVKLRIPAKPAIASSAGVKAAMERHVRAAQEIRNAVDAGEGDFEARQLRERLVADSGNLETRLRLAARYQELDMPELAIEHYRLAASRFPAEAAPQTGLARALHHRGRTAEAAAHLESFLSAYAEAPVEAFSWAGILRDSLGHHHAAEQHHRAALGRANAAAYLRNNLGQNLALQDRAPEAAVEFRAALDLDPSNPAARNNLAMTLVADPAEAARVLEAGGTNDPATAHSNLAAILIEQGRYPEARKELNLALGYKPDHLAALGNLALVSDLDGKPAQMVLPKQMAAAGAANRSPGRGAWSKVGRALKGVFTTSEDRLPEQAASAKPAGAKKKKTAKAGQVNASRPRNSE
jgi:tetratricopeptide (TPR) repeat protein